MKDRIKELRKELKLTQEKFATSLNVTRSFINMVENGVKSPSERTIKDICRIYNANEEWLRTGSGEMFIKKTRKQEIADFFADVLNDEPKSFKVRLINALAALSYEEWEMLANLCEKLVNKEDSDAE